MLPPLARSLGATAAQAQAFLAQIGAALDHPVASAARIQAELPPDLGFAEADALDRLPADTAEAAFVQLWCAKEAVLKAHGHGLSFGLDRLEFTARDGGWALTACDAALGTPDDWSLHAFAPRAGYLATLAWRSRA